MLQESLRQGPLSDSPAAQARKLDELYGNVENPFAIEPAPAGGPGDPIAVEPPPADGNPPEEDGGSLMQDAVDVATGVGASVVRGAAGAVNETVGFIAGLFGADDFNIINEDVLPEERDGALYGFIEGATQFAVGMLGAGKLLKPLNIGKRAYKAFRAVGAGRKAAVAAGRAATPAIAGALTDFAAFDPYEERLSNLLETAAPEFSNPVTQFLQTDQDDPELLSRAKASMEGILLGSTIEGILRGIRALRINRLRKFGKLTDEEAKAQIQAILDEPTPRTREPFDYLIEEDGTATIFIKEDLENFTPDPTEFFERGRLLDPDGQAIDLERLQNWNPEEHTGMWHVTVARSGVMERGLLSRIEAGADAVLGGAGERVSVTWSREHAQSIQTILKNVTRAARGELTGQHVVDEIFPLFEGQTPYEILGSVADLMRESDEVFDDFLERNDLLNAHPIEAEDAFFEAFDRAMEGDLDELVPMLDAYIRMDQGEALELVRTIDSGQKSYLRTYIQGETEEILETFSQYDPEEIAILQVLVRKGSEPVAFRPQENELGFRSSDIEVVERIELRDRAVAERALAGLNMKYTKILNPPNEFRPDEIRAARERLLTRLKGGADPEAPETYQGLGLNMAWTQGWEQVEMLMRSVEEAGEEKFWWYMFNTEGGAGVPWEVTYDNAEKIVERLLKVEGIEGSAVEMARRLQTDLVDLPDKLVAGRMVSKIIGQDIVKLSALVDRFPDNLVYEDNLRAAMTQFMDIQIHLRGAESSVGRALNALKAGFDENLRPIKGDARKALEEAERARQGTVQGFTSTQLRALAREFRLTGADPDLILKTLIHTADVAKHNAKDPGFWDKVLSFRTNMLLSGPKTHVINTINNILTSFQVPLETWWAGKRSGNAALAQQGLDMLPTIMDLKDALDAVRKTWKLGVNILDPVHRIDEGATDQSVATWFGTSAKWLNRLVNLPGRALMAGDEFFKQINYRANVRSQALRLAREDAAHLGIKEGPELDRFLAQRVQEQLDVAFLEGGQGRNPLALQHARYVTFSNDLEYGIGNWLREGSNRYPFIRLIMPFVRTPVNIFRFAWQRTPLLGRLQRQLKEDLAAGGERAAFAKARMEVGAVLYGTGALLALSGRITGNGPSDPELRKQWMDAGNQPYSIRMPDGVTISYQRLEPLATPLALIADGVEAWGELGEEDGADVAYATMGALMSAVSSKTFLFGLSDFFDAIARGETHAVRRLTTNWVTSFSPNFLNQINADEYYREARSIVDAVRARVPGLSTTLEPRRNLFGEKVMKPPLLFQRAMNPFTVMKAEEDDATFAKLVDLGRALPLPSRTRFEGEIDLADRVKYDNGTGQSPYDRMFEIVSNPQWGPPLREALRQLVESPVWDTLGSGSETFPGGGKYEVARQIVAEYYQAAYKQVLREYPALRAEVIRLEGLKAGGLLATLSK